MATLEEELKDLKEKNNELAQKVQYWKMTAAQKDDEKLELMKEINDLRLKLSRLRNNGGFQARKLDAALQDASEKAISHLVKASAEIAKSMEVAKAYMRERQELDAQSPRWSSIGGTPKVEKNERVHRVPPMMMGGQSIQPVVALSRTMLNTSNARSTTRSPNQNRSLTERAVPMHMLQDVYIPLTRIDISDLPNNNIEMEIDTDIVTNNAEDSPEEFVEEFIQHRSGGDDDSLDSDDHISEGDEYETSKLDPVSEEETSPAAIEIEPVRLRLHIDPRENRWHRPDPRDKQPELPKDNQPTPPRNGCPFENPLEGPSWLLDDTPTRSDAPVNSKRPASKTGRSLEPDSTTDKTSNTNPSCIRTEENTEVQAESASAFSPTVRRRKRTSSPPALATPTQRHYSPRPTSSRRNSTSGRVLKVLVAKMRLDGSPGSVSPPKRARSPALTVFDAPSPNGATDSRVIVSESRTSIDLEINTNAARNALRESLEIQQARANSQERETQHTSRSRLSRDHDNTRGTASEQERRYNIQDGRESHHRGRLASQDTRDSGQSSRQRSRLDSRDSRDSDSGSGGAGDSISEGRTRRARKAVTYKEKPLNRKLRR